MLRKIQKIFTALGGLLGGAIVGVMASLVIFHLKMAHETPLPSLSWLLPAIILAASFTGFLIPNHFMYFFLCPFSWLSEMENTIGEPVADDDTTWRDFFGNLAYFLGILTLLTGVLFSFSILVWVGVFGILAFYAVWVRDRNQRRISIETNSQ
ncbi:MAG: hypothetical protein AAGA58_16660 [Verrucomicrobiota bacterium]